MERKRQIKSDKDKEVKNERRTKRRHNPKYRDRKLPKQCGMVPFSIDIDIIPISFWQGADASLASELDEISLMFDDFND